MLMEHRDRLDRWRGATVVYVAAAGRQVLVSDSGETAEGLVLEMIEFVTSMCAGQYRRFEARNRAVRAITLAKRGEVGVA